MWSERIVLWQPDVCREINCGLNQWDDPISRETLLSSGRDVWGCNERGDLLILDGADLDFYCGVRFWSVCLISAILFIAILLSVQQKDWYIITDPKVVWGPDCHKTSWSGPSSPPDRQTLSHSDSWQKQISPPVFVPLTGWTGSTALFLRL